MDASTTKRQKRPAFDREQGLEIAQAMFHGRGYDAVSIADLTKALQINPPSLYAAYGSKLELFERVLATYMARDIFAVEDVLLPDLHPSKALTDLFIAAARHNTADSERLGCMVSEAMEADSPEAAAIAAGFGGERSAMIRRYIEAHAPTESVERIFDYVLVNLRGISSFARLGYSQEKLVDCAILAGGALDGCFARFASEAVEDRATA